MTTDGMTGLFDPAPGITRNNLQRFLTLILAACALAAPIRAGELEKGFQTPPDSAKPHVIWYWLNGNITKKEITADLEAMKHVGLGGALLFNIG